MIRNILMIITLLVAYNSFGQNVKMKKDIIHLDGTEFLRYEKKMNGTDMDGAADEDARGTRSMEIKMLDNRIWGGGVGREEELVGKGLVIADRDEEAEHDTCLKKSNMAGECVLRVVRGRWEEGAESKTG